ncbi:MAG: tyrosine-type recombinase/integrase [Bacteroidetes bacterium]|nr:tyrosine-type recombinase/integrase [Bacteroidota bacterium]
MKHLEIKSVQYTFLLQNFREWLDIIGYAETTVNSLPVHVQELLHFLEQKNITQITQVKARHISDFSNYLKGRKNQTQGGGLSTSHINKALQSINTFAKYLEQTGRYNMDTVLKKLSNEVNERIILTREEIKQLYESTYEPHCTFNSSAMGQRDRAIIGIFYGCGLRKDEGSRLNINDIDLNRKLVFVRKGKGNKQRYVPIANKHAEDIRLYIEEGRYWFLEDHSECAFYYKYGQPRPKKQNPDAEAFFLNVEGKRMSSFYKRLAYMKERSGIKKDFSTHNLRHSIATHLLQSGMPIEEIAKFLGHGSLESTQIYTHIVNQLNNEKDEYQEF